MKKILQTVARHFGIEIINSERLENLNETIAFYQTLLDNFSNGNISEGISRAQLNQDIIVLIATNFKRNGFFVEFGATNGVDLSNTHLLEKSYGWTGILAEPGTIWHNDLANNRTVKIDYNCVWKDTGDVLTFNQATSPELSTIDEFSKSDTQSSKRHNQSSYDVNTISLQDLLAKHVAPKNIDYLSIDTEGSELEILRSFDFSSYEISIIHCEHNFGSEIREKIFALLTELGFVRKFTNLSKWDDWYFKPELFQQ